MSNHSKHAAHDHVHGADCGHTAIAHDGHTDYLHDGHMHRAHGDHVDECVIATDATNPIECTPNHVCTSHAADHIHGDSCGHEVVPHGDHMDYLVDGHLHHAHGDHCDDHGTPAAT
ncbi:MAG: hypothetical protein H0T79_21730 [Deltaproteobacteria bacterium]|nr:hypothetical protein [Deltaproteobacteria bacterium]